MSVNDSSPLRLAPACMNSQNLSNVHLPLRTSSYGFSSPRSVMIFSFMNVTMVPSKSHSETSVIAKSALRLFPILDSSVTSPSHHSLSSRNSGTVSRFMRYPSVSSVFR